MKTEKPLIDLGYEEIFCIKCGVPTNKDDGWCFECSTTPKIVVENVFKESHLRIAIQKLIKDEHINSDGECINRLKLIFGIALCTTDEGVKK